MGSKYRFVFFRISFFLLIILCAQDLTAQTNKLTIGYNLEHQQFVRAASLKSKATLQDILQEPLLLETALQQDIEWLNKTTETALQSFVKSLFTLPLSQESLLEVNEIAGIRKSTFVRLEIQDADTLRVVAKQESKNNNDSAALKKTIASLAETFASVPASIYQSDGSTGLGGRPTRETRAFNFQYFIHVEVAIDEIEPMQLAASNPHPAATFTMIMPARSIAAPLGNRPDLTIGKLLEALSAEDNDLFTTCRDDIPVAESIAKTLNEQTSRNLTALFGPGTFNKFANQQTLSAAFEIELKSGRSVHTARGPVLGDNPAYAAKERALELLQDEIIPTTIAQGRHSIALLEAYEDEWADRQISEIQNQPIEYALGSGNYQLRTAYRPQLILKYELVNR